MNDTTHLPGHTHTDAELIESAETPLQDPSSGADGAAATLLARSPAVDEPHDEPLPGVAAEAGAETEADDAPSGAESDYPEAADYDDADASAEDEPEGAAALLPGFAELGLSEPILRAVAEAGYLTPTPVQQQAIPFVLMGRDVLGCAQTGTGKTAGFTLPMLDILSGSRARARMPRSLILEPTRELALQVAENFVKYGKHLKLTHALIIGGESMSDQKDLLMRGVDVLIATPGRLIDIFERGGLLLTDARLLVIDEADRMLDMGFIPDVERIVAMLPATRQTLFFSATMAPEIRRLADAFLENPKEITVSPPSTVATTITTGLVLVAEEDKREALRRLIKSEDVQNALIFCNRKRDVDILYKSLAKHGFSVGALHGDMAQPVRFATLEKFKNNELRLLCCSDVAARGLDIGGLSHVFNFDVPIHAEDYVHRIGRTGRAGREGHAYTIAQPEERLAVEAIEKLTGKPIPRMQVPGLEVVAWAEGDGRRRRGRSPRGDSAGKPARDGAARAARDGDSTRAPRGDTTRAPRGDTTRAPRGDTTRAPRDGEERGRGSRDRVRDKAPRERAAPAPAPVPASVAVAPPAAERVAERPAQRTARDVAPVRRERLGRETPREAPRPTAPTRDFDRPRERRYRDDDLGPSVTGFGDDVPAFMLVAARPRRDATATRGEEAEVEA